MADPLVVIGTTTVVIGFWCLFLYMAETRKDIGYTFFMMGLSAMTFNDEILKTVQYTIGEGGQAASLPLLMVFISAYEMIMTFMLMRELNARKKALGDDGQ